MGRDLQRPTISRAGGPAVGRWFAFVGGAVAWTAHLMLSYAIGEFGCVLELHETQWAGVTLTGWLLIALTGVTFAVAVAACWIGYRGGGVDGNWLSEPADQADANGGEWGDPRKRASDYLLRTGFLASGLFAVIIVGEAVPLVFYLQRC